MRRVNRGPCPANLDGPQSKGHIERTKAIAHFTSVHPPTSEFNFVEYRAGPVKLQLQTDYRNKCAYCESFVGHVAPIDVDHFRPKNAYRNASGVEVKPGYYWLAAGWDNLFPSCILCNRSSNQTLVNGVIELVGKGTHFPLQDESKRATKPGAEAAEEPLLLNPDQFDVEDHLEFREDGVVVAALIGSSESPKGKQSIKAYGLQRAHLVSRRGEYLQRVTATIARYKRSLKEYNSTHDAGAHHQLEEALKEIREYLCCRKEYLAMTRQHIAKVCPELVPLPDCTTSACICPNF